MTGKLYVIATPIGNLEDISERAINTLRKVDLIAVEDTRKSAILLNAFDIKNKLISNHKFNESSKVSFFIKELLDGKNVGVISDAGTPCISDPGYILVKEAIKNDIEVFGIPGACATTTAISICGFNALSFSFLGFLPRSKKEILNIFNKINNDTLNNIFVFYESPKRILKTMEITSNEFPTFNICLCNDLTKKFEKTYRGTSGQVLAMLKENPSYGKGEYCLVIETRSINNKNKDVSSLNNNENQLASLEALLIENMVQEKISLKTAIKNLNSKRLGFEKDDIYKASLNLKNLFKN